MNMNDGPLVRSLLLAIVRLTARPKTGGPIPGDKIPGAPFLGGLFSEGLFSGQGAKTWVAFFRGDEPGSFFLERLVRATATFR
jgi:hypothetical protein